MARQKKQTVIYFPHYCDHKRTMYILEQRHGNDGYSFWFKLLEVLGKSEGHYYDCNDEHAWEFLVSKLTAGISDPEMRLNEGFCTGLLDLLSKLQAIDPDLWVNRVIWSQNFVDNLNDVYKKRGSGIPSKPTFPLQESPLDGQSGSETTDNSDNPTQDGDRKPQSKVKESKVNNIYVEFPEELKEFNEKFWNIYPSRNGKKLNKEGTFKKYLKLIEPKDRSIFFQAALNYSKSEMIQEGVGIKDPERFISNREHPKYWTEWIDAEDTSQSGGIVPPYHVKGKCK